LSQEINIVEIANQIKDRKILYVEDDEMFLELLDEFFETFELKTIKAKNGREGLNLYSAGKFDLIISDLTMPIMNGVEMIKEIRKNDPNQKIVVVSAHSSKETVEMLEQLTVDTILHKPIDFRMLMQTIYDNTTPTP